MIDIKKTPNTSKDGYYAAATTADYNDGDCITSHSRSNRKEKKMGNKVTKIRTNYFRVTDSAKFIDIINKCTTENGNRINVRTEMKDGNTLYSFSCGSDILGLKVPNANCTKDSCKDCMVYDLCETNSEWNEFSKELQTVIAPDDAIIISAVSYEGLRYIQSYAEVITSKDFSALTLSDLAFAKAQAMLGNNRWTTKNYN